MKIDGLTYHPDNGMFTVHSNGVDFPHGSISGKGYMVSWVNKKLQYHHRLAWELVNGPIPEDMQVDHINGIRTDNRIENLRLVTSSGQSKNQKLREDNKSGYPGVFWRSQRKKWSAYINSEGKRKYLGLFSSKDEAIDARKEAEKQMGYHSNHGRV